MVLWFVVGFVVWVLCVIFMLAVIKGGHRVRGSGYEQKLYFRSMVNTQKVKKSRKKKMKKAAGKSQNQCLPVS